MPCIGVVSGHVRAGGTDSNWQDLSWVLIDFDPAISRYTITGLSYDGRLDPEKSKKATTISQVMDNFDASRLTPLEKASIKCVALALREMSGRDKAVFHYGPIIGWARMKRFDF